MVDDEVGDEVELVAEGLDFVPSTEAGVNLGMVDGIESSIGAVDGVEEGQQVHATEEVGERTVEEALEFFEAGSGEAIDVSNELNLILH